MAKKAKEANHSNFVHPLQYKTYLTCPTTWHLLPAHMLTHIFACLLAHPQIHLLTHLLTCLPISLSTF